MAGQCRGGFTPNLVVGVAVTLAGGALLLDTLDLMDMRQALRFWPALVILFGASIVAQALRGAQPGTTGASHRPIVGPGFIILLVFLGVMVSSRLQPPGNNWPDRNGENVIALMSRTDRTSDGEPFRGADMITVMGRSRLDLRDAVLAPGDEAYIDVFGLMGAVDVVVPEGWEVEVEAVPMMGQVRDRRLFPMRLPELTPSPEAVPGSEAADEPAPTLPDDAAPSTASAGPPPRLILRGFMMMGALTIES